MRLPSLVTRSLGERMVRDAEWRVRAELGLGEDAQARPLGMIAAVSARGGIRTRTALAGSGF
jgi:hypothetical protein